MVDNEENNIKDVPYLVHEGVMARMERQIHRLWVALICAIVALVVTVIAFLWYLNLYDYESYEITAQGDGHANYIGQDGDIYNGTSTSAQESEEKARVGQG